MLSAVANGGDDDGDDDETMMTMTSGWPSPRVSRIHHQSSKPFGPPMGSLSAWIVGGSGSNSNRDVDEGDSAWRLQKPSGMLPVPPFRLVSPTASTSSEITTAIESDYYYNTITATAVANQIANSSLAILTWMQSASSSRCRGTVPIPPRPCCTWTSDD